MEILELVAGIADIASIKHRDLRMALLFGIPVVLLTVVALMLFVR